MSLRIRGGRSTEKAPYRRLDFLLETRSGGGQLSAMCNTASLKLGLDCECVCVSGRDAERLFVLVPVCI